MVLDKKAQLAFHEKVKDYQTLKEFGTTFYYLLREAVIVVKYFELSNNLVIVYDVESKEFKECLKQELFSISSQDYGDLSIKKAGDLLWEQRDAFKQNIFGTLSRAIKAPAKKPQLKSTFDEDFDGIRGISYYTQPVPPEPINPF